MHRVDIAFDDATRARVVTHLDAHEAKRHPLEGRRHAAVAVTLVADDAGRACFVITKRAATLKSHSAQWALPGGRLDPGENSVEAALRELREEVALSVPPEAVIGRLDDYPTRSGYVITPIVVWGPEQPRFEANPAEVASIHLVPLVDLDEPQVPWLREIPESDRPVLAIPLDVLDTAIHAPTAAVLFQLREVAVHGRDTRVDHYEQPVFAWK